VPLNACFICGHQGEDVAWCPACSKWLCGACRTNYPLRARAAMGEAMNSILKRAGLR
jgi:hypothetical protein